MKLYYSWNVTLEFCVFAVTKKSDLCEQSDGIFYLIMVLMLFQHVKF